MAGRPKLAAIIRHTLSRRQPVDRQTAVFPSSAGHFAATRETSKPSPGKTSSTHAANNMDRQQGDGRPPKRKANSQTVNQRQQFQDGGPNVVDQDRPLQDFSSFPPQPYPGMMPFMNFPAMGFLPQFPNVQQPAFMPDPQFGSIPWQACPLPFPFAPMTDQPLPPLMNEFTPINQLRGGGEQRGRGGEEYHHLPAAAEAAPSRPQPSRLKTATSATASASGDQGDRGSAARGRGPIVPPSAESGGVPAPTAAYLAQAGRPARQLQRPQPLLVVLDLNGTLLHRPNRKRPTHFVARRYARDFLNYLLDTFWVVIWSSARPGNITGMTEQLLTPAQRARLVAVWSRDDFGLSPADYGRRVQCYKRLAALWADARVASSHPHFAAGDGRWGQANTVLVDDSVEKARSEPYNLVRIPENTGLVFVWFWCVGVVLVLSGCGGLV